MQKKKKEEKKLYVRRNTGDAGEAFALRPLSDLAYVCLYVCVCVRLIGHQEAILATATFAICYIFSLLMPHTSTVQLSLHISDRFHLFPSYHIPLLPCVLISLSFDFL